MLASSVHTKLVEILRSVGGIRHEIDGDDLLREDLGLNSLNFIELIVEIETGFDITVPDELIVADGIKTVDDLTSVILGTM